MARVVVLATVEPHPETLASLVAPDDEVHVVVPAVEQSRLQWLANEEDEARTIAEGIGRSIEAAAPTARTSSETKVDNPAQLLVDAVREHRPERVVVLLRAGDDAWWLEEGELGRMPDSFEGVPVERFAVG